MKRINSIIILLLITIFGSCNIIKKNDNIEKNIIDSTVTEGVYKLETNVDSLDLNLPKHFKLTDTVFELGSEYRFYAIISFSYFHSIDFEYDDAERLDSIASLLTTYNLYAEIQCHTNFTDLADRNIILTQKRAEAVKDYLIIKGVYPDSLIAKGYGESQPLIITKEIHDKYPLLPIGQKLDEEFFNTLDRFQREYLIYMTLNDRYVVKILREND